MFRAKTDREKSDGEEEGEGGIGADKRLYYDRGVELSRDTGAIWPKKQSIERERYRVEETLCRFLEKIGHADIYIYILFERIAKDRFTKLSVKSSLKFDQWKIGKIFFVSKFNFIIRLMGDLID